MIDDTLPPILPSAMPSASRAHPLEVIPLFRRWPPSTTRDLVYTALWSSLLGVGIALAVPGLHGDAMPPARALVATVAIANLIGFPIHAGLALLRRRRQRGATPPFWMRVGAAIGLYGGSTLFGIAVGTRLFGEATSLQAAARAAGANLPVVGVVVVLVAAALWLVERRVARERLAARREQQLAEAGRLLAEARLRALQAQIEPHFLYNTLANVVSLIGADPARARHMLERLIDFLRASLSASRAEQATLGAELELAGAYLDLLAVRLGARLRYRVEADAGVRTLPIPPMLVQPLVENAVMHGIEPALAGGTIVVRAHARDGILSVEVCDDGAGLSGGGPRPGGGVGLANLRERLRSLHGAGARLELLENPGGGVTSRLLLPLSPIEPEVPPSPPSAP